ncbi:hypothetical protein BDK89_1092 [Ilumatobacter fluminis]|uniref:Uncharacterized protein n=1 Tax=Ilumatobacter fluminis TaxID=467091 RepID=A0A4R7HWV4_9ACTN|nr:hypothetical protein [Ilumatobacter fluminis]TDT15521.1 hypothetical protein BDK89_1092 [Ilumatobacter fluminis]
MLPRRLTASLVACGVALLASCGGGDEIEDAVVRPGITAIEEARSETCAANASVLRQAIDTYTILEGEPPVDEAALVPDYIREATTDWDIVDGEIVAENPACGDVPEVVPLDDIITSSSELPTGEQILASWTDDQIDGVGGLECATELTEILAAAPRFAEEQGVDPAGLPDLVDAGYLGELPELWTVSDTDELVPTDDSPCTPLAG